MTNSVAGPGIETEFRQHLIVAVGSPLPTPSQPAGSQQGPVVLTAKNLQCMRAILSVAHCHGAVLGSAWHLVLTTLQVILIFIYFFKNLSFHYYFHSYLWFYFVASGLDSRFETIQWWFVKIFTTTYWSEHVFSSGSEYRSRASWPTRLIVDVEQVIRIESVFGWRSSPPLGRRSSSAFTGGHGSGLFQSGLFTITSALKEKELTLNYFPLLFFCRNPLSLQLPSF